jgi:transcriptional regulator with XRE-family HTH domain
VGVTDVGTLIRHCRYAAGWMISDLAAAADVDPARVAEMEDGATMPTMYECEALERALPGCGRQELGVLAYGDTYRGISGFEAPVSED